jgi:PGF-CTERM protein
MNLRPAAVVFVLTLVILVGVSESFALPQYLTSLTTVYGIGSCSTCHVSASGGARNSYGKLFENQPNFNNDPIAALKTIGAPPKAMATTPGVTGTISPTIPPTPEITKEIPDEEETQEKTQTQDEIETPAETAASAVTTVKAAGTPTTPGFGIVAAIVGLFALALLVKRNNR